VDRNNVHHVILYGNFACRGKRVVRTESSFARVPRRMMHSAARLDCARVSRNSTSLAASSRIRRVVSRGFASAGDTSARLSRPCPILRVLRVRTGTARKRHTRARAARR